MKLSKTVELAQNLIARPSVTPEDCGCQPLMGERLQAAGFELEWMKFEEVDNLWARRGQDGPLFVFAGHTDVVPTGPESQWCHPPFEPVIEDGYLYGRGAADMKGSLAAMVTAVERFVDAYPQHRGSIAFLITSDEEGPSINGTVKVVEKLQQRNEKITWCLVGEPSSTDHAGDVIKNGRRGSLNATLTVQGVQGHVAYPHLAKNPVHALAPVLSELCAEVWDQGNEFFPPTSMQISNINAGTGATNVIPGEVRMLLNWRFSTELTVDDIKKRTQVIFDKLSVPYQIDWSLSGMPFLTAKGALVDAACQAIEKVAGIQTQLLTSGGTSDGRFIAPTGAEVIELGPVNATIHKVDECVAVADLDRVSDYYYEILVNLLAHE